MRIPFVFTLVTLALAWTVPGHTALVEMFPEQAPESGTSNPLAQLGLGTAEVGATAALVPADRLVRDTIEKSLARLNAKVSKIAVKIKDLERQIVEAGPGNQADAIRASIATKESQYEVLRAEKNVEYAKYLITESEYARLVEEDRLMSMAASANGMGVFAANPFPARNIEWRKYRVVTPEVKYAEQVETQASLRKANAELDEALKRVQGTRNQIERFPIQQGESALRVELEHVQTLAFARLAAEKEELLAHKIVRLQGKVISINEKSLRVLRSNPTLTEKIIGSLHGPVVGLIGGAIMTDILLRVYLYYQGRDPGYAPFAKVITHELQAEATK